jgi:hypothetical protein
MEHNGLILLWLANVNLVFVSGRGESAFRALSNFADKLRRVTLKRTTDGSSILGQILMHSADPSQS